MKKKIPHFKSLAEERSFWQTHNAFEVFGEEGWELIEAGTTVHSLYVVKVGKHGATVRIPKALLNKLKTRNGQKLRVWTEGNRLVLEASRK
jgi:hypothetical protein